jgi:hypothetical protein
VNEIGRYALIAIAVAAIVGIVLVAVRVFGIGIPWWFEAICWILLAALVCNPMNATLFAVILLAMADAAPAVPPPAPGFPWNDFFKLVEAIGLGYIGYLTYKARAASTQNAGAIQEVADKSDANGAKIDGVHMMSNSRLTDMQSTIGSLQDEIRGLTGQLEYLKGQAAGSNQPSSSPPPSSPGGALEQHLGPDPLAAKADPPRSGAS